MKKVLLMLALMMPFIFMSSCSDDDSIIKKDQLIGTWVINSEIDNYTRVEISFKEGDVFELITITERVIENVSSTSREKRTGRYTIKDDKISFDNYYYFLISSLENNVLKGELSFNNGTYNVIAIKQ